MPSSFVFRTSAGRSLAANSNFFNPPLPPSPVTISGVTAGSTGTGLVAGNPVTDVVTGASATNGISYNVYSFQPGTGVLPAASSSSQATYTINYSCANATTVYVLAVGGGGAGGGGGGGGGGAGGVVMLPINLPAGSNTISVNVGAGGAVPSTTSTVIPGSNTTVSFTAMPSSNIIAYGGGGSNYGFNTWSGSQSMQGGSNGGYGWSGAAYTGTTQYYPPISNNYNYGNQGGVSASNQTALGGGGGGAGTAGNAGTPISATTGYPGNGGIGIQCYLPGIAQFIPSGTPYGTYYWGGGGGAAGNTDSYSVSVGNGGLGGGGGGTNQSPTSTIVGLGGSSSINTGSNGTNGSTQGGNAGANTGGGGGGGWAGNGGAGGSGIVVIAFPSSSVITYSQSAVLPSSIVSSNMYNALLNNASLSALTYNTVKAAYATRLLNYNYFGPVMTLRHSLDTLGSYTQNFYADICGNMATGYLGTGQSVTNWLTTNGANTTYAYVTKWYSQGMDISFNCATQYTIASQPIYDVSTGVINYGNTTAGYGIAAPQTNCYLNLPNATFPVGDASFSLIFSYYNLSNTGSGTFFTAGTTGTSSANMSLFTNGSNYYYSCWNDDYTFTPVPSNTTAKTTVTLKYAPNAGAGVSNAFVNGSAAGTASKTAVRAHATTAINNCIGYTPSAYQGYMNGSMGYLYIFNSAVTDADRNLIEATSSSQPSPQMVVTLSTFLNLGSFTPTFSYSGATYYIMYINGNYIGPVVSGTTITYASTAANNFVNIYAYTSSSNLTLLAVGNVVVTYPIIYLRFLPGDITGTTLINYGVAGNATLVGYNGSYVPTISTTTYPTGTTSSLQITSTSTAGTYFGYSSAYLGGSVSPPNYNWGITRSAPSGITIAFWFYYNGTGDPGPWNIVGGNYNQISLTYGYNIGNPGTVGTGTFTYNSTSYPTYTGVGLFCNTYPNGNNKGLLKFFGFINVPLYTSKVWNHFALTVSPSYTNPVWTAYFNGTPYVLGSSTFAIQNAFSAATIGYPYGTDGVNNNGIYNWANSSPAYQWSPASFIKNYATFNSCLTSTQITALMNAA